MNALPRMTALLLLALTLPACAPVTLTLTLFAEQNRLYEAELHRDPKARQKIAIIDIRGLLADSKGGGAGGLLGSSPNPVDELAAQLARAEFDREVAAVILRINSPGGTVTSSDMMYREIRSFAERSGKPVIASFGEMAASGGYYIALAADHIIAEPTCITGSIGVIIPTFNFSEGLNRIGIHSRSVTSANNKDIANPFEPMHEEHYEILQSLVDEFYNQFRATVIARRGPGGGELGGEVGRAVGRASRPPRAVHTTRHAHNPGQAPTRRYINPETINNITDGRILSGLQAHHHGLVDQTGGIRDAFTTAKALAGLESARLVKYFRQDSERPRTPYAMAPATDSPGNLEINLLQINTPAFSNLSPGLAYYLYIPPAGP